MKVWGLPANPAAAAEKPPLARNGDLEVFLPEEVWVVVRAADSEQDAAIFLTAAFTGLRMGELLALRRRDATSPIGGPRPRQLSTQQLRGFPAFRRLLGTSFSTCCAWSGVIRVLELTGPRMECRAGRRCRREHKPLAARERSRAARACLLY